MKVLKLKLASFYLHCCGSGAFTTPGSGSRDGKKSRSRIWDEHPGYYFENMLSVFRLKILIFFDSDPDLGSCQPWIRDGKIGSAILDKHPESATTGWIFFLSCNIKIKF
jgi:hypothetical protein